VLLKPSHYDDSGYVIQWFRSAMPSNSLAVLTGLAQDCADRSVLGEDVEIELTVMDETNTRVRPERIAQRIRKDGGMGLIGLVGVQSNQYPRALDLARRFRDAGLQVCIGGFHVSGIRAMFPDLTPELQEALDLGVTLFAGEAEGRLERVLRDAHRGEMKPIYDHMDDLPNIQGVPLPRLSAEAVNRTAGSQGSFDAGRGCPFQCSFCTIINVQGRKSRFRSADDVEAILRWNLAQGIKRFFITDDNFARNQNWESIFDRLIELRENEGIDARLIIQVDTLCHRIEGFIEKAGRAGVRRVFIGLESINAQNLSAVKKGQNRLDEYREMLLAWRAQSITSFAGYILGFPGETPESIARDVKTIQRELPVDFLEFTVMTPLPGSEDHRRMVNDGVKLDPDLNVYDLCHPTFEHDRMSREEIQRAYLLAWETYYSHEHVDTLLRRAQATDLSLGKILGTSAMYYGCVMLEGVHPLEGGVLRYKFRKDRRPGLPIEGRAMFYAKYVGHFLATVWTIARYYAKHMSLRRELKRDQNAFHYTDRALTPPEAKDGERFQTFTAPEPERTREPA
jgi:radical SAM superfamily enzyme YgiQ (UPF0313 family)